MYKAIDRLNNREVVIIDPKWADAIESLRAMDRQDILLCQGCNQPVRVRAGEERRHHFAHKHLRNCNYADESLALREARAVLYQWLVGKFGDHVTIEKKDDAFFRPIDCWVEKDSKKYAYWIIDVTMKPDKRLQVLEGFLGLGVVAIFVFTADMLHGDPGDAARIHLTTTEREFLQRSDYDLGKGQSLHYLDSATRRIHTYRSLQLVHSPQVYEGVRFDIGLDDVLISPKNGEFVHPGERERLSQYREEQEAMEKRLREAEEHNRRFVLSRMAEPRPVSMPRPTSNPAPLRERPPYSIIQSLEKVGTCVFCGRETTDWWTHDGTTGMCKCNACLRQGITE
jgi:hypothetical protein